ALVFIHRQALTVDQLVLQVCQGRVIELELPLQRAVGQASPALEHGNRLVENLLKGHRPPSRGRCGVRQTVWEWEKPVGLFIPKRGNKRKPAVLGARDAAVTLLSQPRGRRCHVCVGILHPASTLTKYRSTPCPPPHETLHTTPKPNAAVIAQRRSASRGTAARRSMPRRSWSGPSMTWVSPTTLHRI